MKSSIIFPIVVVAALISCNSNKTKTETTETETTENATTIDGKWRLADYAGPEEMMVVDTETNYYLQFNPEDSTFGLTTDCNTIGGTYKATADSLVFTDTFATQMECPDMAVEKSMLSILPVIDNYAVFGDSVLILRASGRQYATFTRVND